MLNIFYNCKSLTSLTLPNSIMNISFKMFWECSGLNSIIIPGSVTSIEQSAFYGCSGLSDVYCYADMVPSTDYFVFDDSTPEHATLHVPAASVRAYQAVEPWKNFKEIVALTGSDLMSIGIITIESLTNGKSVIYDMNGRRHSGQPTKGLYIHNGKKVVVK